MLGQRSIMVTETNKFVQKWLLNLIILSFKFSHYIPVALINTITSNNTLFFNHLPRSPSAVHFPSQIDHLTLEDNTERMN